MKNTKARLKVNPVAAWPAYKQRPLVISGPCSAESEQQMLKTARKLAAGGKVDILRAGIWKPRTRPGSFEGMGTEGLKWLKMAGEETGLSTATEVASATHVYEALKYGITHLWIGARSTANPFVVQEIAGALEGSGVTVLIKNPVNPDLDLWLGAIERIKTAGIDNIGAIHRGFSSFEKTRYRNVPHWMIPVELKQRVENLPLICDPSHICGNRTMLAEVAQKAMDLNFDGLMLESHINPDQALSDAAQQITPRRLFGLLSGLTMRKIESGDSFFSNILEELRRKIDIFDEQLIELLEQRMNVAEDIARHKKENNITILQSGRWSKVIRKNIASGSGKGLSRDFISKLFRHIHQESISHQNQIMNTTHSGTCEATAK